MRKIRVPLAVFVFSFMLTGAALAADIQDITTQNVGGVILPSLAIVGEGGSLPGIGDALIASFYDVRPLVAAPFSGGRLTPEGTTLPTTQFTLISIVNTDDSFSVIARLRFREWKRSREVLDLDIPLTPRDVWVGVVSRNANGGANLWSPDTYVTNIVDLCPGNIPFTAGPFPGDGFAFRTFLIESSESNLLARTEYGYFEIFGEERVVANAAKTQYNRLPPNQRDVENVLFGNVVLLRPEGAQSHQYNMTAISDFAIDPCGIWRDPGTEAPNFFSEVQGGDTNCDGAADNAGSGGFNNLEALLSKRFVDFQYATGVEESTPETTSTVITFPTKHFHYSRSGTFARLGDSPNGTCPFGTPFTQSNEADPAKGEFVRARVWDRNEEELTTPTQPISPSPQAGCFVLPYEVNVVGAYSFSATAPVFRDNVVLATFNNETQQKFITGWSQIDLSPSIINKPSCDLRNTPQGEILATQADVARSFNFFNNIFAAYRGLPALGIVMTEFFNASINGYYGNTVPWQFGVDWRQQATLAD